MLRLSTLFLSTFCSAILAETTLDITNCAKNIYERCPLNEYLVSTLEIVDREINNHEKADAYFWRQICNNMHEEMINFKKCVFGNAGQQCWMWHGSFDSIRLLHAEGDDSKTSQIARRMEQLFVIIDYNLCGDNERRKEYLEIRGCSHKRFVQDNPLAFHERYTKCLKSDEVNPIQEAMDKMDLCKGHNKDYSCFIDSMLGESCEKVRKALMSYASLHAGHGGVHEHELEHLNFLLQAAHSDHLRLPKPEECHLLKNRRVEERGLIGVVMPAKIYYFLLCFSFVFVGALIFYFRYDLMDLFESIFVRK